ncbi:GNAT family N-acetyltransferase [Pseudoruegeria sp. HB172150]|uniref:GNAT family N-acetyltransferase n=1 Tax=Pseudoruegeria sp. HB172150 TaxID=2721164 RepID=UPI00155398A8|nr:GNAT family N-acetyltransferase [Pseudoruegeria sp. HB172150]
MNPYRFDIRSLTPERWEDFETVLGKSGQSGCWCMYWLADGSRAFRDGARGGGEATNRSAFRTIVEKGPAPGLLAYDRDVPVAWVRILPRSRHPSLENSRFFRTQLPTDHVWSLSCFVVRAKWRRHGLTEQLTRAAIRYAREHGARAVEAYPTETDEKKDSSSIYMGVASTFRRLGFEEVQRKAPHKPMMRLFLN